MDDGAFGLRRLGQVLVPVADLARAVSFYRDKLGMRFLFEVPHMAFFELDGVRLMLGEREGRGGGAITGSILYYQVADLSAAHRALAERGVDFDADPAVIADMGGHELWMAFFHDSEGNQLALMAEVPTA